jgi:hypothetical protein
MLPPGYRGVLICDTRRAEQWDRALTRLGIEVEAVETEGADAEKGAWQLGVREDQAERALALISAVAAGRAELPGGPVLSSTGFRALAVIAVILALVLGGVLLAWVSGRL